jgi:hypothetical protein
MEKKRMRTLFFYMFAFVLFSTVCYGREIKVGFDPSADFTKYKTYGLISGTDIAEAGQMQNPDLASAVEDLIRAQMTEKGLEEEEVGGTPDLIARYWVATQQKQKVTDLADWGGYDPFWDGGWWGPMYDEVMIKNYQKGTMLLDLIDTKTKKLVWRAYLVGSLNEDSGKAMVEADQDLTKAFEKFPPKK